VKIQVLEVIRERLGTAEGAPTKERIELRASFF
jgi:hypothetical protein